MNSKDLYDAISEVDDEILERSEVATRDGKRKGGWWG